jgi:hypothetical protein
MDQYNLKPLIHNGFIVDKFDQEGAMDEVFAERLAVGFPVDHIHGSRCPFISLLDIFPYRQSQGLLSDCSLVSRCNCLALAVLLGGVARESRDGVCFMVRDGVIRFGKSIGADIQLGLD